MEEIVETMLCWLVIKEEVAAADMEDLEVMVGQLVEEAEEDMEVMAEMDMRLAVVAEDMGQQELVAMIVMEELPQEVEDLEVRGPLVVMVETEFV